MTRKFVNGDIVKIERGFKKRYLYAKGQTNKYGYLKNKYGYLVGKYARVNGVFIRTHPAFLFATFNKTVWREKRVCFFVKILNDKKMGNRIFLVYRNEISHVSKKIQEEILAKEIAEKL